MTRYMAAVPHDLQRNLQRTYHLDPTEEEEGPICQRQTPDLDLSHILQGAYPDWSMLSGSSNELAHPLMRRYFVISS